MAKWISQTNVYEATYWEYGSSLLSRSSNPNSSYFTTFRERLRSGFGFRLGRRVDDDDHEPGHDDDHHNRSDHDHHHDGRWEHREYGEHRG